jgi:hypothetical protein
LRNLDRNKRAERKDRCLSSAKTAADSLLAYDSERTADIGNSAEQRDGIEQSMLQDKGGSPKRVLLSELID